MITLTGCTMSTTTSCEVKDEYGRDTEVYRKLRVCEYAR